MSANLENLAVTTGQEKSVFISTPKDSANFFFFKLPIVLILHASKVMLKILQAKLQQYVN